MQKLKDLPAGRHIVSLWQAANKSDRDIEIGKLA